MGVIFGLVIGIPSGMVFMAGIFAWRSYKASKKLLPLQKKAAWAGVRRSAVRIAIIGIVLFALAEWVVAQGNLPAPVSEVTTPSPSASPSPSGHS
jgi:hypothetical protein